MEQYEYSPDGKFTVEKQIVISKITKIRDKCWDEINSLQEKGFDKYSNTKETYDDAVKMFKCYDSLLKENPKNQEELDKLSWLFNEGKLRNKQEISQYNFRKKLSSNLNKNARSEEEHFKVNISLIFILSPIIPFIFMLYDYSNLGQGLTLYFMAYCISFMMHYFILNGVSILENFIHNEQDKVLYDLAGLKKPINLKLGIDTGFYLYSLHKFFKH